VIVVKLGGSILTTKGGAKRVRGATLARLASELRGTPDLVVLHGAGSFGHVLARRARLREGLRTPAQRKAAAQVRRDVLALHTAVLDALGAAGLRAWSLPTGALALAADGELDALPVAPFQAAVEQGFVPVAMGDVVLDAKQGIAIVSADAVAQHLAAHLGVERMVFATDVDGLFDRDPALPGAQLLRETTPAHLRAMRFGGSRNPDVTGGMEGKARAIADMAARGCEVWVVNGLVPGRVRDAVRGKTGVGTRVLA